MRKLHELIEHLDSLMYSFNETSKFVLYEDILPYRKSIKVYYEYKDLVWVSTDSYGVAGFLASQDELHEALEEYISSLQPENKIEFDEWMDSVTLIYF